MRKPIGMFILMKIILNNNIFVNDTEFGSYKSIAIVDKSKVQLSALVYDQLKDKVFYKQYLEQIKQKLEYLSMYFQYYKHDSIGPRFI